MSKETKTTNKTKSTGKWDKSQRLGFWVLIIGLALFWGGYAFGTQATLNGIAEREQVKAQAIEDYKASLADEQ